MTAHWNATVDEITGAMPGDDLIVEPQLNVTRCIDIEATPDAVFPWLRQMGFGRAGWYSYDWLDNLGRLSATRIHPEWQHLASGDEVPGGPTSFIAVTVEPSQVLVLALGTPDARRRVAFTLAYDLRANGDHTRLVTRVRARINAPGGALIAQRLLGPGDGFMLRRQLRGVKERAERST